jgi:ABC-type multidrug transport system fused ATPase/permease subunit
LLKRSRIIVLDEATSCMDKHTEKLIHEVLHTLFKESTMIIIAHRLSTIMECDKVMVLEAGRLLEFDTPQNLLRNRSQFASLHEEAEKLGHFL